MDKFFTQEFCDRCGGSLEDGRIMSRYNTDCICMKCKEAETRRPDYEEAMKAEHEAVKAGNYNFAGIGFKPLPETYQEMSKRHQSEVNALPLAFAFSDRQYKEQLAAWDMTEEEAKAGAIIAIGAGGFIRSTDRDQVFSTFDRIHSEQRAAIEADTTATGYIFQGLKYELINHEYAYTGDTTEAIEAVGLTEEDLKREEVQAAIKRAAREVMGAGDPFDE